MSRPELTASEAGPAHSVAPAGIDQIRAILNARYRGWSGPSDPRFISGEIEYKQRAIEKARARLAEGALRELISSGRHAEVIERLEEIGKSTNLLFVSMPRTGDLKILYDPALDRAAFTGRILDLLHGPGSPPERLDRYVDWVEEQGLPNNWTFPTYFLYLTHPENNVLVKPKAVGNFLALVGADVELGSRPSGAVYRRVIEIASEVGHAVLGGPTPDMVPIQSVMWIAGWAGAAMGANRFDGDRQRTLERLLAEFERTYTATDQGRAHLAAYPRIRETARANFEEILAVQRAGGDITDLVLTKLLPHRDSEVNRERGAWVHVAPAISADVRTWFENAGWVQPDDWPAVSRTIFEFVQKVVDDPDSLESACSKIGESEYGQGLHTGMLTPILSALVPDQMILINNKSRAIVNYFLGLEHSQRIADYPALNRAAHYLIDRVHEPLAATLPEGVTPQEGFDAFSYWLIAIKQFRFGRAHAWKVTVRGQEEWRRWHDGGFIGLDEPALEDLSRVRKKDWETVRENALARGTDAIGDRLDEVWAMASEAQEGDPVLVVEGTDRVLGIGMVIGGYEYHAGTSPEHRIAIEWQDTQPRAISEPGWRGRFHGIDPKHVDRIRALPPVEREVENALFGARTFELLEGIHADPTRDFYSAHQEDFRAFVENPLKSLLTGVAELLPKSMKEVLETEKRLFSMIPKNDYGRGGAWDFYWGAFYPRGGRRIESAQLFLWISREHLEFGFTLGEYATDHYDRFVTNVNRRRESIVAALTPHIRTEDLVFGASREGSVVVDPGKRGLSIRDWLADYEESEVSVRVIVPRDELLRTSEADLKQRVLSTFEQLFPLILLATSDDPLPAIAEYWGSETDDEDEIQPEYPLETCASETGFDLSSLRRWVDAVNRKGQAIFYGPPGTGKTYIAERIARHLIGGGDGFSELVQFHPAYAYEDFIQGIRPITRPDGQLEYQMVPGRFLDFCRRAQNRSGLCVLIIDEINRANLSRVFGELMYLLEYRDRDIPLSSGGIFRIPGNVRLLGTMNTADRSIALVDHALRRRFAFVPLRPRFEILRAFHEEAGRSVDTLIDKVTQINRAISDPNYHVGITFFLDPKLDENLETIWRMEIEPYLEEYFFDDPGTVDGFRWERIGEELGG